MKKSLIPIISILTLGLASAQFSFSDMLNQVDSSLILLSAIFIVAFMLINFSLSKIFKEQKNIATIISIVLSFLIVFGINRLDFDVESFFFDLGVSEDIILTIAPILILTAMIFVIIKFAKESLLIIGGFFLFISRIIEDGTAFLIIGLILIIIRFFIPKGKWKMKKRTNINAGAGI